jgi:hypothetical protein
MRHKMQPTRFEDMPTLGGWNAVTWDNRTLADRAAQEAQQNASATERQRLATLLESWREYCETPHYSADGTPRDYDPMTPADWFREEG